ncbi:4-hydroxyphenylpyruvate dioxygenase [Helianthus annuus]|nr:4-hydroxyphenylpyruvate dioxygenase [Helianthus annuus]
MGTEATVAAVVAGDESDHPTSAFKLVGFKNFIRTNPMSDKFTVKNFHHIEFWCSDATNTARRFSWGLGMPIIFKSDLSTGNSTHASYLLRSGHLNFLFTAPYSPSISPTTTTASIPTFSHSASRHFTATHGLAVRVYGTKRKSQIQTYLEHNEGAGVQHLALASEDIFRTLREMRKRSGVGGFEFMPSPPPTYYRNLKSRAGDVLSDEQIKECEELGILVDRDDQGTLLQIFTKPVGDRPTIFIEIIQRVGCMVKDDEGKVQQKAGCGGFGKGNFSELFKSIEEYEKTLEARSTTAAA